VKQVKLFITATADLIKGGVADVGSIIKTVVEVCCRKPELA
jgi:hypothetical protein